MQIHITDKLLNITCIIFYVKKVKYEVDILVEYTRKC